MPATYYIEMDPGVANADGSASPTSSRRPTSSILSSIWDDWSEPNDSREGRVRRGRTGARRATSASSATTSDLLPAVPTVPTDEPRRTSTRLPARAGARRHPDLPGGREHRASSCERVRAAAPDADILVVDDNSPDGTADLAEKVGAELGRIDVLRRPQKIGLGDAVPRRLRARASTAATTSSSQMDADLSHDPAALPTLLADDRRRRRRSRSARATSPAARSRTGRGTAAALSKWGNRYATLRARHADPRRDRRASARTAPTCSRPSTSRSTRAKGYGFQIELCVPRVAARRPHRRGADHVHRPRARRIEDVAERRAPRSSRSSRGGASATACSSGTAARAA